MNEEPQFSGVRYIESNGKVYFIWLKCFNQHKDGLTGNKHKGLSFFTTDCIIEKIEDADTGTEIESISGKGAMSKCVLYQKNKRITNARTYYVKTVDDLLKVHFVYKTESGHYYVSLLNRICEPLD